MKTLNEIKSSELAVFLGVTPPFISHVKHGRRRLSSEQALKVNAEYGVPLYILLPKIYPKSLFPTVTS